MCGFRREYCGLFGDHKTHMLDPDADGNVVCSRPGCGHCELMICTCRLDPDYTKYVGCPKHTVNPRLIEYPKKWLVGFGCGSRPTPEAAAAMNWYPDDMGGPEGVTYEQAALAAQELIRR